ncbi:protein Opi10p [Trichomonascus vanleenenianus]|uniref:Opi10p n=1 Tax=Trichomonascus vanleenenianus TaxID=2268995 RepID=UPI003ECB49CA
MFGLICSGRPVQPSQQVSPTQYVFQIENGARINHVVVFLLPDATLPTDMAASVYFQLPGKDFQLLGGLSQSKPSAIFKLNNSQAPAEIDAEDQMMTDDATQSDYTINVGISIEPAAQVEANLEQKKALVLSTKPKPLNANDTAVLANKIVQHAYNFLSGFTGSDGKVSMKVFDDWWAKFKAKLANNPKFLDNLD